MRIPCDIATTLNVYLAFRAALIAVLEYNKTAIKPINSGLGTGIGNVPPERAAYQMRQAYNAILGGNVSKPYTAREILAAHHQLIS